MSVQAGIGDMVPDIALVGPDGAAVKPSDFRGRKLVLFFYPKDDTPGCTTEAKDFSALAGDFAAAGADIVGVSRDTTAKHGKFVAKHDLTIPLASDEDGAVCEAFGTWIEKSLYGRQYMGIDRATFLIDTGGVIRRIWRKVKVKGHGEAVLEAVKAL